MSGGPRDPRRPARQIVGCPQRAPGRQQQFGRRPAPGRPQRLGIRATPGRLQQPGSRLTRAPPRPLGRRPAPSRSGRPQQVARVAPRADILRVRTEHTHELADDLR
jgi:hypothetical protein